MGPYGNGLPTLLVFQAYLQSLLLFEEVLQDRRCHESLASTLIKYITGVLILSKFISELAKAVSS
jgi:hypothetical protein